MAQDPEPEVYVPASRGRRIFGISGATVVKWLLVGAVGLMVFDAFMTQEQQIAKLTRENTELRGAVFAQIEELHSRADFLCVELQLLHVQTLPGLAPKCLDRDRSIGR
jgi:hypothetical protein